jgi:5-methylcytosine-specific restriction enzyme A
MSRPRNLTGKHLNEIWEVGAKHALYSGEGTWYHLLQEFPGALFDSNGYVVFETYEEYMSSSHLRIGQELNILGGISKIPKYVKITEQAKLQLLSQTIKKVSEDQKAPRSQGTFLPVSIEAPKGQYIIKHNIIQGQRVIRDTKVSTWVKYIHEYKCQFCGLQLQIGEDQYYAEAHHIKPLGNDHNGPDVVENILCVCPNHHALLDLAAIEIDITKLRRIEGHEINPEYIGYHNSVICKKWSS